MNPAEFLSALVARGVEFQAHGDRLRFRPADRLSPNELETIRQHKTEILKLLEPQPREEIKPWPETPACRMSALCSPPAVPLDQDRFRRCLRICDRCGSAVYTDVSIHDGRSLRRDCARCNRFLGWPRWYDQLFDCLN